MIHFIKAPLNSLPNVRRLQNTSTRIRAFQIDRKLHMEIAWQRQQEQEVRNELKRTSVESGEITEVEDLAQLDLLLETAGSRLVLLFLYSKACGVCKEAKLRYSELSQESKNQRARVAFLQHNIVDEYDQVSDIARWCGVKAVPCFLFLDGGAVIDRVSMRDMRRLAGSKNMIQKAITDDIGRLHKKYFSVLLRCTPSAR